MPAVMFSILAFMLAPLLPVLVIVGRLATDI